VSDLGLGSYSSRRSSQGRDGVWPGGPLRSPAAEAVWQSSPGDGGPDRLLARLDKTVPVYKTVPGYPCRVPVPARPVPAPSDGPWRTGAAPRAAGGPSSCVRRSTHGPVQEPSRLRRGRAETGLRVRNVNDPSAGGPTAASIRPRPSTAPSRMTRDVELKSLARRVRLPDPHETAERGLGRSHRT
jgi:hypothetical protein